MTVQDLIDYLNDQNPEAEVRTMQQESYPFEYSIQGTWVPLPLKPHIEECTCGEATYCECGYDEQGDQFKPKDAPKDGVVYLVEGSQLAYGTKDAWEELEMF